MVSKALLSLRDIAVGHPVYALLESAVCVVLKAADLRPG